MKKFNLIFLILCFSTIVFINFAFADETKIAIIDLTTKWVKDKSMEQDLNNVVQTTFQNDGRFQIIDTQVINTAMTELGISSCSDAKCAYEIGQKVGADKAFAGDVRLFGTKYIIFITAVDVQTGETESEKQLQTRENVIELFKNNVKELVSEVEVIDTNSPPVANNDDIQATKNEESKTNILSNDKDSDGELATNTIQIVKKPNHGTIEIDDATGEVKYFPEDNYVGPDMFTYKVKDDKGADSNIATVKIEVSPGEKKKVVSEFLQGEITQIIGDDIAVVDLGEVDGLEEGQILYVFREDSEGKVDWKNPTARLKITFLDETVSETMIISEEGEILFAGDIVTDKVKEDPWWWRNKYWLGGGLGLLSGGVYFLIPTDGEEEKSGITIPTLPFN